jgi:adenylylsulfate kinase
MTQSVGWCVWVTGLPGSGKSVIAQKLLRRLEQQGISAQLVSIDMLRKVVTPKPTYSEKERDMVYASLVFISKLLTQNGVNVIIDATANRQRYRDYARKQIPRFIEAYVHCPLQVCIEREAKRGKTFMAPRDIYKKAFTRKSKTVPGIGVPYEQPPNAEVTVDSDKQSPEECAEKIYKTIARTFQT